jgi:hypothetical protein
MSIERIPCPSCATPLSPDAIVCTKCRTRLKLDKTGKHFIGRRAPASRPAPSQVSTHKPQNAQLQPCAVCGHGVLVGAKACPSCGKPLSKAPVTAIVVGLLIGILLLPLFLSMRASEATTRGDSNSGTEISRSNGEANSLIGQCAYNPSDLKYLGRVIKVGPEGVNAYGESMPGQRAVTVDIPGVGDVPTTYPRFLVVKPCN